MNGAFAMVQDGTYSTVWRFDELCVFVFKRVFGLP